MNLVIYSHVFAPKVGGVETYVMLLAQGMAEHCVRVTVITSTPAGTMDDSQLPFRVVRQPGVIKLFQLLRQAEVVHLAGPSLVPLWMAILLRKPVVIEHHGYQAICPNGLLFFEPTKTICPDHFMAHRYHKCLKCNAVTNGWGKSLGGLLLTIPRRVASSLATRNIAISRHVEGRLRLPRTQVIYYGIRDPQQCGSSAPDGACGSGESPRTFAYVGRLVSEKGLGLLIEAASRLETAGRTFQIKMIGDGPERNHLQERVDSTDLGHRVSFTGSLQGEALESALSDVSTVVMPSIWEETAGLSAIEQMMRGRLVIATDIGGLGEMLGDAGLKFPCGDVERLTNCFQVALDKPNLVTELGKAARARAAQVFSHQRMVNDYMKVFSQALRARAGL